MFFFRKDTGAYDGDWNRSHIGVVEFDGIK
jgi:hypothetical protein